MLPGQLTEEPRLRITKLAVPPGAKLSELADGEAEARNGPADAGPAVGTKIIQFSCKSPMASSVGVTPGRAWFMVSRNVCWPPRVRVWRLPALSVSGT